MTGLGSLLPYPVASRVVPLVPTRFQRFVTVDNWKQAEIESAGYARLQAASAEAKPLSPAPGPTKVRVFDSRELQLIAAFGVCLARCPSTDPVRVLDLGGFRGEHRSVIASAFPDIPFIWTIVEIPEVATRLSSHADDQVQWTSDLSAVASLGADICLASATLNYMPEPFDALRTLAECAPHVIVTRLPLWPIAQHAIAIQRPGRRTSASGYPTWFFSDERFREQLAELGTVVLEFVVPEDRSYAAGHFGSYQGLVLRSSVLDNSETSRQ